MIQVADAWFAPHLLTLLDDDPAMASTIRCSFTVPDLKWNPLNGLTGIEHHTSVESLSVLEKLAYPIFFVSDQSSAVFFPFTRMLHGRDDGSVQAYWYFGRTDNLKAMCELSKIETPLFSDGLADDHRKVVKDLSSAKHLPAFTSDHGYPYVIVTDIQE